MQKELSVAFVWHFHQPNYQTQQGGIRLMPWARLHAVKDYLDMVLILDKFPKIKLNFSIVPALLDAIKDYAENDMIFTQNLPLPPSKSYPMTINYIF